MKIINGKLLASILLSGAIVGLSSCTGLMMSSDFGYDDYGPVYTGGYLPNYGIGYNPPLGYYGPAWNTPPPPPPAPAPSRPNGSNRPNYAPPQQSQPQQPSRPVQSTAPNGQQRPGNMGQPAPSGNNQSGGNQSGSSGTHRGR
ncbi:MAG: hypothetical protein K2M54_03350 [Muribaculaceae bacterium]|nr:hypothetical protein [Muribaculaceae bacterium]